MVSDSVGDFIIQLKNAGNAKKPRVSLPYSKLRHAIADKLVEAGYVEDVQQNGKLSTATLELSIKYRQDGKPVINGVKRLSKPGRRLYTKSSSIYQVKYGHGHLLLSTPAGILTGEEAKKQNVGGEQLFIIW